MVRSRIGPLALEVPLGKSGGTLYRAIHVQQRSQVALRLLSFPLGLTPEAKKQFMDDVDRLKALRHDHIVRCFGGGFDGNDAYLVYELINGESLEDQLSRVERLPWEIVLQYGLQMCDALQFAHNQGWLHQNLSTSQVLCQTDQQSIKLSDFRGEAISRLASRPRTLQSLSYQAPEQFTSGFTPHPALDLYALGAILYHALTGFPPVRGDSIEHIRQQALNAEIPPVATVVFDCPVWLSKIVDQLLQKNPVQRPFTAAAVAMALQEAERRAMSGASVVEHAMGGFSPLQMNLDKDEAEKALGVKPKKKRKSANSDVPLLERPLVLIACIALAIGLTAYMLMPLDEATMRRRAEKLLANQDGISYNDARDRYLIPMVTRFPSGQHREWAESQLEFIEMVNAEAKMDRNARFNRDPSSEGERRYSEARRYERFGDRISALERYKAIVELYQENPDERPFVNLSLRQIREIEAEPPDKEELKRFLTGKLDEAEQLYERGDVLAAKKIWDSILSLYNGNAEMVSIVSRAQRRIDRMRDGS